MQEAVANYLRKSWLKQKAKKKTSNLKKVNGIFQKPFNIDHLIAIFFVFVIFVV